MIFPTDLLRVRVLAELARRTGIDFGDALVLNATHTHSGPARYWAAPYGAGIFGMDEFDPAVLQGLAESIASVVEEAWLRLAPARIGAGELLRFDPEDKINRDRRPYNDNLYTDPDDPNVYRDSSGTWRSKDHRLWVLRVENSAGEPIAAVVRIGMHGTVFSDHNYTEDAPGMVERAVERDWDVPVAIYMQGCAGDASPAGGDHDRAGSQAVEAVGVRLARVGANLWSSIETIDHGTFAIAHRRRNISRAALGYADNEFGVGSGADFQPYAWGAFQCGEFGDVEGVDVGNPSTTLQDGALGCIPIDGLEGVLGDSDQFELPFGELSVANLTAIRLGDWTIATMPGEPVSQMDTTLRRNLAAAGLSTEKLAVFGYSQAHLFYLTPKDDWFQGGYEAVMNIWGWKLGDFIAAELTQVVSRLDRYGDEPAWDGDTRVPLRREHETRLAEVAATPTPQWTGLTTTAVERLALIQGSFNGGDSWIDPARVELVDATGRVVQQNSDFGWRLDAVDGGASGRYVVTFEPGIEIATGRYRFVARGRYRDAAGMVADYAVTSPEFSVSGNSSLALTGTVAPASLHLFAAWPSHPVLVEQALAGEIDRRQRSGFRLIDPEFGPNEHAPVRGGIAQVRWTAWPSGLVQTGSATWQGACSCYELSASWPPATTGITIAAGDFVIDDNRNSSGALLAP